ncbi:hypothetical protein LWI29_030455 [Acer saccharum]|uniref:Aldehyde dehydrogenase domain-containing protein n=1 Tax=Acer saccharum TaxID=4024 RepID=A0AA39S5H0_ACESA|nr:hypothetical protein LWI29_030455 [Acer saccharum]
MPRFETRIVHVSRYKKGRLGPKLFEGCRSRDRDINDVIRKANATHYGLAVGVFTGSLETANTMMRVLKAGIVWINCFDVFDTAIPFRCYKMSAIGKEKGIYNLNNYLQV